MIGELSSNFCVCHWSALRLMTFFDSSGEIERTEPEEASDVGTVLPFWCISNPLTIFSMFLNSEAVEFLWTAVPFAFLLLLVVGTCGVKADEDCCDNGRWLVDGDGDADGELEFALMFCEGLLLRLLSGALSALAFDWPGVTASKAEPCAWKPGRWYGENRWAFRLWSGEVGEWPE